MRLSSEHDPKYLRLGLILVFTGFLVALLFVTQIYASDLYDLSQDTPFLISSDYDSSVFGYRVGSGSTSWIREEFGLLYANLNDNNNVSSFTDLITYQVTASDSWSDSYAVKRGGFNASNFGIVSGSLLTPENGFIFDNSVEEFHLSKNQWVRVFQCPRLLNYGISQGYYQIYFYDAYKDFMSGSTIDAGRHPVICMCIPQEHYNEFVLTTDSFEYPYQDYKVFYYDYSMSSGGGLIGWVGILPLPFSFEYGYTLAYSDRSVLIRANGNRVKIESMKFADQVPSTPSPSPLPSPSGPLPGDGLDFSDLVLRARQEFEAANPSLLVINFSGTGESGFQSFGTFQVIERSLYDSSLIPVFSTYTDGNNHYYAEVDFKYADVNWHYITYSDDVFTFGSSFLNSSLVKTSSPYQSNFFNNCKKVAFIPSYLQGGPYFSNIFGLFYPLWSTSEPAAPSPSPEPSSSPTPTLSPTPPPYVVVITPEPEASPTPPIQLVTSGPMPSWFPPGDPLIPLDPEIQDDVFGNFSGKVSDNAAFGFLGLLMALIPSESIWFLWFLLFILIVLGIAKVIIHFTGG